MIMIMTIDAVEFAEDAEDVEDVEDGIKHTVSWGVFSPAFTIFL